MGIILRDRYTADNIRNLTAAQDKVTDRLVAFTQNLDSDSPMFTGAPTEYSDETIALAKELAVKSQEFAQLIAELESQVLAVVGERRGLASNPSGEPLVPDA